MVGGATFSYFNVSALEEKVQNVSITIKLSSLDYEDFVTWIQPFSTDFHNFTFIIERESGQYDWFLNNQTRIDFLSSIGEVIPAGGAYSSEGHSEGFIQTFTPEMRIYYMNSTLNEWKQHIGTIPKGFFMFQPDTDVSNFMLENGVEYQIGYCFDQYVVDWMTMRGGWQLPYYSYSKNSLVPENTTQGGFIVYPWLTWDWLDSFTLGHNYDTHPIDVLDTQVGDAASYISSLIEANLAATQPFGYSAFSFEYDWLKLSNNLETAGKVITHLLNNSTYEKLSVGNFTEWFKTNYASTPTYTVDFVSPYSKQGIEWYYSQQYRIARTNGSVLSFIDYTHQEQDPFITKTAIVNFSEIRSPTNAIDTSLNFTIDALGGGKYRSPIVDIPVTYSGELPSFPQYYYGEPPTNSTYPSLTPSPSIPELPSPTTSEIPASQSPTQQPTASPSASQIEPQQTGFLGTNLPMKYGYIIMAIAVILVVVGVGIALRTKKH